MRDKWFFLFQPVEGVEIENHEAVEVGVGQPIAGTNAVPAAGADGERLTVDRVEREWRSRVDDGWPPGGYHNGHFARVFVHRSVDELRLDVRNWKCVVREDAPGLPDEHRVRGVGYGLTVRQCADAFD